MSRKQRNIKEIEAATELEKAGLRGAARVWWDDRNPRLSHRLDGPAVIWRGGEKEWYIHGIRVQDFDDYQGLTGCSDEDVVFLKIKWGEISHYQWV